MKPEEDRAVELVVREQPRRMDRWAGKVAIVTGASSGIGHDTAIALVKHGVKVVGLARRMDKLQELATKLGKGKFYPVQCDLRKEEDILKAFQFTEKELGGADILVNNAGVIVEGPITDASTEDYRKILDVNVIATAICTREIVRSIKKRNATGHIFNVNSIVGHYADSIKLPLNLYPASKYAITAMTLAVRHEISVAKLDIKVTSVSPGAVRTQMLTEVGLPKDVLKHLPMLEPQDIADAIIYALGTPPRAEIWEVTATPRNATAHEYNPDSQ